MTNSTIDYGLIGERIRNKRKELCLTQEQLAQELNLTSVYLSKIENGKVSATLETLAFIAYRLEIDLSFLISGTSTIEKKYYIIELNEICSRASKEQLHLISKIAKTIIED